MVRIAVCRQSNTQAKACCVSIQIHHISIEFHMQSTLSIVCILAHFPTEPDRRSVHRRCPPQQWWKVTLLYIYCRCTIWRCFYFPGAFHIFCTFTSTPLHLRGKYSCIILLLQCNSGTSYGRF